jgi:bifunctional oligoribonuclease and PAP phosphatase NrnA
MQLSEVKSLIENQSKIFIVTHKNPDGDAMGSSLGLASVLRKKGCAVTVVAPTEYPDFLKWIVGDDTVKVWGEHTDEIKKSAEEADLLFCLDFNALHRIDEVGELVAAATGKKVMIDHHQQPDAFADYTISDTTASSTAEMVYDFVESIGLDDLIDGDAGEALYCGIMTDTGSFRFPSTTSKTHRITANIVEKGADHSMVYRRIFESNTEATLRVIGHCMSTMELMNKEGVAIIKISKADHYKLKIKKGDTEGVVNYGLTMPHIKCAAFFREDKGIVKISFRSKDDYDVNAFAREYFNGGGHVNAAGGMSKDSLDATIEHFKSIIKNK